MITCSCGKPIDKMPDWLQGVKVDFVCNNCPNRQTKNIAFIQLDPDPKPKTDEPDMGLEDEDSEAEA